MDNTRYEQHKIPRCEIKNLQAWLILNGWKEDKTHDFMVSSTLRVTYIVMRKPSHKQEMIYDPLLYIYNTGRIDSLTHQPSVGEIIKRWIYRARNQS